MKITRRQFIKGSTLGMAGVVGISPFLQAMSRDDGIPLPNPFDLASFPTTCLQCNAHCGVLGFFESSQLVSVYGNPKHPNSRGKICARGMAGINMAYDTERLLLPLRRVGKRGEGNWRKISWDEAYDEMAQALKEIQSSKEWLFLETGREEILTRRFLRALDISRIFLNTAPTDMNGKRARVLTWGEDTIIPDVGHSEYILNFGANPYEHHDLYVPFMDRLIGGRISNRAKLVTIDVRLSHTASKSDEWLPILPGTDGMVALAMANVIMKEGLFDKDFMREWTNYPLNELISYLSSFSAEKAEKLSGLNRETIQRIALEFARSKPAVAISGGGVSEHVNGTQNERCVMLLNALVGNIDKRGGCLLPRRLSLKEPLPHPPETELLENVGTIEEAFSRIRKENSRIGLYLGYLANPAYCDPQCNSTIELLKDETSISRLIVIDTHLSETAALADMVLPAATYLESWGIDNPPSFDLAPFLAIRQPIIRLLGETEALRSNRTAKLTEPIVRPLGEAVSWGDVLIEVAKRIGGKMKEYFTFNSSEDFIDETLNQFDGLKFMGVIKNLKKDGFWVPPGGNIDYKSYLKKGFKTPSGKYEVYSSWLKKMGFSPLPSPEPITHPGKGEFILVTFMPNIQTLRTSNSKWLSEAAHENSVWINKEVGRSMGFHDGDEIKIESEIGSITGKAHLTAGIHPQAVAISRGFGHWGFGNVSRGKRFKSPDPDTRAVWWDSNGVNPNPIIPINRDPLGGGQAWNGTRVKIYKV
ncbi:MAG: molybdopterin-dependent oxidoreductase [Desulfobacterales bacterium]